MTGKRLFDELTRRFGFPERLFRDWALVDHEDDVFITTPEVEEFSRVRPVRKGIRLVRVFRHGIKPTTNAMQIFGRYATRNVIELTGEQASKFVQGEDLEIAADVNEDFVIVQHEGFTLGVGLYRHGILKSQVPLSRRTQGTRPECNVPSAK
jgi:NOL1/NOP2/fmu family ribosome biogenesis protein